MVVNPFVPSFGAVPPELAGRSHIINEFELGLEGPAGHPNRSMLLIGGRGTGKTVLLEVAVRRARARGWVAVTASASPPGGLTARLTAAALERLQEESGWWRRIVGVRAFGLGVTLSDAHSTDARLESVLTELAKRVLKRGSGVMINVDELQIADADEVRAVGNVLQLIANRRESPIAFLGAGLPSLVRNLLTGEQATFLQRCARHRVGLIEIADVRQALVKPLERCNVPIEDDALDLMVESTGGYPYMVQLVGMCVWNAAENAQHGLTLKHAEIGIAAARQRLAQTVIEPELGKLDRASRAVFDILVRNESSLTFSELAESVQNDDEEALSTTLQQMMDAGLVEEDLYNDRYGLAFPTSREWITSRLDSGPGDRVGTPWSVPAPTTPAENGTHVLSEHAKIEATLREQPHASYHSIAREHGVNAAYTRGVAIEAGLTRFSWKDLFLHLRHRSRI